MLRIHDWGNDHFCLFQKEYSNASIIPYKARQASRERLRDYNFLFYLLQAVGDVDSEEEEEEIEVQNHPSDEEEEEEEQDDPKGTPFGMEPISIND